MKRLSVCALFALAVLSGCTNSPAHRIAECEKKGGTEAACTQAEWDHEKAHPLPQFDPSNYNNAPVLQAAFNASEARSKSDKR